MSAPTDDDPTTYRLPYSVVPSRYRLTLVPDLAAGTFTGDVAIDVTVSEPVTDIVLNAAELTIGSAALEPGRCRGRRQWRIGWHRPTRPLLDHPRRRRGAGHPHLCPARPGRPGHPPPVLHRNPERQAPRLLPEQLHRRRRQRAAHRHHPVGGHRRPSGLPLLGRARPQGRLRGDPGRHRGPRRLFQRARSSRRPRPARGIGPGPPDPVRPDHADVHLSGRLHRRAPRGHRAGRRRRRPPAGGAPAGQGPPGPLRPGGGGPRPPLLHRLLRHPYPADKLDLVAIPDFAFGAMENLGCVTFRETGAPGRPGPSGPGGARAGGRRHLPRDRPHVVRRPGHHEVVERHLAQRGLRHVHGGPGGRRLSPRMAAVGQLRGGTGGGHGRRRPPCHPTGRVRRGAPRGGSGHVRRPDLPEGRERAQDAGALPRGRNLPRRHPATT